MGLDPGRGRRACDSDPCSVQPRWRWLRPVDKSLRTVQHGGGGHTHTDTDTHLSGTEDNTRTTSEEHV
eukprot:7891857-Alexandrium_andersonii.AAC.1